MMASRYNKEKLTGNKLHEPAPHLQENSSKGCMDCGCLAAVGSSDWFITDWPTVHSGLSLAKLINLLTPPQTK